MPQSQRERAQWTFRTDKGHQDVYDRLAKERGLQRQIFMELLVAEALGLPRPSRTPAIPLDFAELRAEAQALFHPEPQEVLYRTA